VATTRATVRLAIAGAVCVLVAAYATVVIRRGFSATAEPSAVEKVVARAVRNLGIAARARDEQNPVPATPAALDAGRSRFTAQCAGCHGLDGGGNTAMGRGLYPKPPDLRTGATQELTDGQIHYIIENGVRLSGMPAWSHPGARPNDDSWTLVAFIRSLRPLTGDERVVAAQTIKDAHYVGSASCESCHADIYARWKKTPMANVVLDAKEHPEAIIPDLATNTVKKFTKDEVALVYGSIWKQRYFTRIGDDYFPQPSQWDVTHKQWRPYFVAKDTDWWEPFYPADNMQRPTGPTCDGCHSVGYDVRTKQVVEWNVGCERCHGPGSEHVARPTRANVVNPTHLSDVASTDSCVQCHSQGKPTSNPIEGRYYDWPVGYQVGLNLRDFWTLEEHTLGTTTFTHFADGTAHKNRMQGNDFVQSLMYRRGVTCATCHDVHGTSNGAQLRKPATQICLDCHAPLSPNGPRAPTLEAHTHHTAGSAGSECVACHMPKIETTIADIKVSAHTFKFISPALTDRFQIPNPCTTCHTDKSTSWALEAMRKWPEQSPWRLD
jgi:predicted CXXCH cytochrome family protein